MGVWNSLFMPVGTPPKVMKKIFDATAQVVQRPKVMVTPVREGTAVGCPGHPKTSRRF